LAAANPPAAKPQPPEPAPAAPAPGGEERLAALQLEVEARVAETRWLRDQFRERLREAEAETEALRQRLEANGPAPAAQRAGDDEDLAAAHREVQRLQSEMVNLSNANERYLARIYELKKALEDRGDFETFGG
jgi:chromosome segregation ATPase